MAYRIEREYYNSWDRLFAHLARAKIRVGTDLLQPVIDPVTSWMKFELIPR